MGKVKFSRDKKSLIKATGIEGEYIVPDTVVKIRQDAFADCEGLTSVVVPSSVKFIGNYAFADCTSLKSVVISDSVKEIEENVFKDCTALNATIIVNDMLVLVAKDAAGTFVIPHGVRRIVGGAFRIATK